MHTSHRRDEGGERTGSKVKITIETEAADELVLDTTGADKDRAEAVRLTDRRVLFQALKSEVEFRIRLDSKRKAAERGTRDMAKARR